MSRSLSRRPVVASLALAPVLRRRRRPRRGLGRHRRDPEVRHQGLQAAGRRRAARDDDRLRDLRQAGAGWPQRRAADPRLHLEPSHGRPHHRQRRRGLVGRLVGPGKAIDTDRLYRRVVQHAGLVLRLDQPGIQEPGDRQALRAGLPRHHPGRHRRRAEGAARQPRRQAPGRGRRPVVRRLPDLPVGRHLSRLHGRAGGGGQRAQGLGRRGSGASR